MFHQVGAFPDFDLYRGLEATPVTAYMPQTCDVSSMGFHYIRDFLPSTDLFLDNGAHNISSSNYCYRCVEDCINEDVQCHYVSRTLEGFAYTTNGLLRPDLLEVTPTS